MKNGPILLTPPSALPDEVVDEVDRLGPSEAYVLGSTNAVSAAVQTQLGGLLGPANVHRLEGLTRYETADAIAQEVAAAQGGTVGSAFFTTGANFPDALPASGWAAVDAYPIFLVPPQGIRQSTLDLVEAIGVEDGYVLGDENAVSQAVEDTLAAEFGGHDHVVRLDGASRYETARAIADHAVSVRGLNANGLALATGSNFPDALSGGPLQGKNGSVLLLSAPAYLHPAAEGFLSAHADDVFLMYALGGSTALSDGTWSSAVEAVK